MIYLRDLIFQDKFHSKWLVLFIDLTIVVFSICLSVVLINKLTLNKESQFYIAFYCFNTLFIFFIMRVHTRIIRYSNTKDMLRIFFAVFFSNVTFLFLCRTFFGSYFGMQALGVILLINFFISSSLLTGMRIIIKDLYSYFNGPRYAVKRENVLIYGSNEPSILIKRALGAQKGLLLNVQGFIDTGSDKIYKHLEQTQVYPIKAIENLKKKFSIASMFITADELTIDGKRAAIDKCIELGIKIITVPPSDQWINGQPNLKQFKDLKIEDLLEREPIELCNHQICNEIKGKRILITGAAGSIGSEIVRQVLSYDPEFIVLCDQAETPLHDLQLELEDAPHGSKIKMFVADIQNTNRIQTLFDVYQPQIVFHAAAYKHVPMMENNPTAAVLTNIWGTKNLADISVERGVEKFIMISTDKAVRPTNVMGASKRIAEMYIQALNNAINKPVYHIQKAGKLKGRTKFTTTRFGNVLGSNGSVIPRFKAQIKQGGPVTVTHPEITRYFMTISESVQLVLEAFTMGNGGEIFLFDMGKPIKITDLAANMIKLAGFTPEIDIKIVFTGLRPGEKLYEELLNDNEQAIPTYNKDIKISKTSPSCYSELNTAVDELLELNMLGNVDTVVSKMKSILPDFISNNSQYQKLDNMPALKSELAI